MRTKCGLAMSIAFAFMVCGCNFQTAATPEDAIRKFVEDEMLIMAGQYPAVREGEGEAMGEEVKWYEPKTLNADLRVRGNLGSQTIPKGTRVFRLVFTYKGAGRYEKHNTKGWRLQNPRHAGNYEDDDKNSDAVFYVDKHNQVLWVSPAEFWDHTAGEMTVHRVYNDASIDETHSF